MSNTEAERPLNHYSTDLHATQVEMHPGLHKVMDFMYRGLPADELRGVASALATVAPAIWACFPETKIRPIKQVYKINQLESIVSGNNELPED